MITVLSYDRILEEQRIIEKGCRSDVAKRTDDQLNYARIMTGDELLAFQKQNPLTDISYYEIQSRQDVEGLRRLRQSKSGGMLVIITSPEISPVHYLKPGIAPDLLLLRPFNQSRFDEMNAELFDAFLEYRDHSDEEEKFVLKTREGTRLIPYGRISYFEACNKKINIRTGREEYDFYDSLDNLMENVPEYFIRSHRSYLVNSKKIQRVKLSEGIIELAGGVIVPLSRAYRREFRKLTR